MQKPITNLERNNYNTNYKTKHTKHQKIINKELDLLLKFFQNTDTHLSHNEMSYLCNMSYYSNLFTEYTVHIKFAAVVCLVEGQFSLPWKTVKFVTLQHRILILKLSRQEGQNFNPTKE